MAPTGGKEQRAKSKEQRAKSKEQLAARILKIFGKITVLPILGVGKTTALQVPGPNRGQGGRKEQRAKIICVHSKLCPLLWVLGGLLTTMSRRRHIRSAFPRGEVA